jgi:hypothetical protein
LQGSTALTGIFRLVPLLINDTDSITCIYVSGLAGLVLRVLLSIYARDFTEEKK